MLIILSGLPGVGKTAIALELARRTASVHLRIDSIEQAIRPFVSRPLEDIGYRIAYAIAGDNLRAGRMVIADSVNPVQLTRDAWRDVAFQAGAPVIEVELRCSDADEHRRRIATRIADIPGFSPPAWEDVAAREYHPWIRERLVIDTAVRSVEQAVALILQALPRE